MRALGLVVVSFVAMEPVTYAVHRWIMHGPGHPVHHSHHRPPPGRLETNDLYPVAFAAVVGVALAVGFNVDGWGWLVPVGAGVTLYGAAYGAVHDGHIHGRLRFLARLRWRYLDRLADGAPHPPPLRRGALRHAPAHRAGGAQGAGGDVGAGPAAPPGVTSLRAGSSTSGHPHRLCHARPQMARRTVTQAPRREGVTTGQVARGSRPSHVPCER